MASLREYIFVVFLESWLACLRIDWQQQEVGKVV